MEEGNELYRQSRTNSERVSNAIQTEAAKAAMRGGNNMDPALSAIASTGTTVGSNQISRDTEDVIEILSRDRDGRDMVSPRSFVNKQRTEQMLRQDGVPEKYINVFSFEDDVIDERMDRLDLFPSYDRGIISGYHQSKTLGSVPIYGSAAVLTPTEAFAKRRRSIQAAQKQAEQKRAQLQMLAYAQGAPQMQPQIDDMYFDMIQGWMEKYNGELEDITNDPQAYLDFNRDAQKLRTFAAETVRIQGLAEATLKNALDEKNYVPPRVLSAIEEWSAANVNLKDLYDDPSKLSRIGNLFDTYDSMLHQVDKIIPDIQTDIQGIIASDLENPQMAQKVQDMVSVIKSTNSAQLIGTTMLEYLGEDRLMDIAKGVKESGRFVQDEKEIAEYIGSMFGNQLKLDTSTLDIFEEQARLRIKQAGDGSETGTPETIFGEIRNVMYDENSQTLKADWLNQAKALENATDKEIGEWWGKSMNLYVSPDDDLLRGELQMNMANTPVQNLSAGIPGLRIQHKQKDGTHQWVDAKEYQARIEANYKDQLETYNTDLEMYNQSVRNGNQEAVFETNAFDELDANARGELAMYIQLQNSESAMVMDVRATEGFVEAQYITDDGELLPVEKSAVKHGADFLDRAKPYASLTYVQYRDGSPSTNLPLINVVYDLTSEAGAQLDAIYSKENTQQIRDDRGQGGNRGESTPQRKMVEKLIDL